MIARICPHSIKQPSSCRRPNKSAYTHEGENDSKSIKRMTEWIPEPKLRYSNYSLQTIKIIAIEQDELLNLANLD